jgi:hypothetical protein
MGKVAFTTDQRKRKSVEKPKDDARKGKGKSLKKSSPAEQPLSDEYVAECKSKVGHSLIEIYVRKHEIFLLFIKVTWLQNCGVFLENKSKIMFISILKHLTSAPLCRSMKTDSSV